MAKNPRDIVEYQSDHDLLIELRTEMRGAREDITELKTNMSGRVNSLEGDRISKQEFEAVCQDIETLKLWRATLVGAWAICTLILIPLAFAYFTHGW
jgi:hypothetical protein